MLVCACAFVKSSIHGLSQESRPSVDYEVAQLQYVASRRRATYPVLASPFIAWLAFDPAILFYNELQSMRD